MPIPGAKPESLAEALPREMARVREVLGHYRPIPAMQAAALEALEALEQVTVSETFFRDPRGDRAGPAIDGLRAALDAGEPQPVATMHVVPDRLWLRFRVLPRGLELPTVEHFLYASPVATPHCRVQAIELTDAQRAMLTSTASEIPGVASPVAAAPQGDAKRLHDELLYAVHRKFPGESRHETALRYIRQAEAAATSPEPASASPTLNEQGKRG